MRGKGQVRQHVAGVIICFYLLCYQRLPQTSKRWEATTSSDKNIKLQLTKIFMQHNFRPCTTTACSV